MNILKKMFGNNTLSCEEELNILDIEDDIFYSIDNKASIYIKIDPIPFEYLSSNEKNIIVKRLTSELAGQRDIIKIITMSLPVLISEISKYLLEKRRETKNAFKRKKLLEQVNDIEELINKEKIVEKRVIVQLFNKIENDVYEKLGKRAKEFVIKLQNAGIKSHILQNKQILQLFNSFLNMKFEKENVTHDRGKIYE